MRESMLHQTLHVHIASNTLKNKEENKEIIQFSDWPNDAVCFDFT